jgi:hypothetical protein
VAIAGLVTAVLGVGGVLAVGQLAAANDPVVPPPSTVPEPESPPEPGDLLDELLGDVRGPMWGALEGLPALGEVGRCLASELGLERPAGGTLDRERVAELTADDLAAAWEACKGGLPDDVQRTVDDVTSCAERVMQQLPTADGSADHGTGGVAVVTPEQLSVLEFGDGDGRVTITKSGDEYTVESSGDVSEVDLGSLDELAADVGDALAECDIGLPFDMGRLDLGEILRGD